MSHPINRPAAVRWLQWYAPELAAAAISGGIALLYPFVGSLVAVLAAALILGQETWRIGTNLAARIKSGRSRATTRDAA